MSRPPKYKDAESLQKKVNEYFDTLSANEKKTITGLCYHLGFESRQSFYRLEDNEALSYTIKRARMRIEHHYESLLQGNSVAGPIFALKNLGWVDSQSIDHTSKGDKMGPLQVIVDSSETAETLKKLRNGSQTD